MSRSLQHSIVALGLSFFITACGGARRAPMTAPTVADVPLSTRRVVSGATGQTVPFVQMADAAAKADVVFFGEAHDDEETHRAELALLTAVGERRTKVVLSLEMFERDVQPVLDSYLAGRITEAEFREQSRPWPNYGADYRPMLELARAKGWPVIAANAPRRLASMVSRQGLASLDSLPTADRALVAREIECPKDRYYRKFVDVMSGGHGGGAAGGGAASMDAMMDQFYQAQCIKDETMAESIVAARAKAGADAIVVHITGAFHSDEALGTVSRVTRRLPGVKGLVVSAVPTADPANEAAADHLERGQFIIFALRIKP